KLSGFLLDLRRSLAHKGFAKILDISTGMPAVFANPYASRSQHVSSQKIAQLRLYVTIIEKGVSSFFASPSFLPSAWIERGSRRLNS
ncbi:MAG: hypothetical protein U9R02_03865, partial [Thermodesulfobacteriota bacterium]|nr:hypothetical protein [Thermodesulfobacteriota bacterium]